MASTWLIHDKDGGVLGQTRALSAKVAFVLYMSDRGRTVNLRDITVEKLDDGRVRVTHGRKIHFLKKDEK